MLQENKTENRINPFFVPYNTPHDTVPFDRIRLEDYEEAFMEGIRRDDEATDKIVNDPEEPTFENTLARVDTEKGEHYYDEPHPYQACQRYHPEQETLRTHQVRTRPSQPRVECRGTDVARYKL